MDLRTDRTRGVEDFFLFIGFVSFGFHSYFLGSLDSRRQALEKGPL